MSLGAGHQWGHWGPRLFLFPSLLHGPEVRGFVRPGPAVMCCLDVTDRNVRHRETKKTFFSL